ncbi:MAG TPA: hypothetical protein VK524_20080, partial [Polyangiaceae bacterium]|nr:hypothetical protein [Polyangiaceae bacterium]
MLRLRRYGWITAIAVAGCTRSKPPPEERRDPWPAQPPAATAAPPTKLAFTRFHADESSELRVDLRASEARFSCSVRVLRADLLVNPLALASTRGELRADLGSLVVHAEKALDRQRYTAQAQNWLDIGASRPEAERTRLRWARFEITGVQDLSAGAAHQGRVLTSLPDWDAGAAPEPNEPETS